MHVDGATSPARFDFGSKISIGDVLTDSLESEKLFNQKEDVEVHIECWREFSDWS